MGAKTAKKPTKKAAPAAPLPGNKQSTPAKKGAGKPKKGR